MRFSWLPALACVLFLSACGGKAKDEITYAPLSKPGERLCAAQCHEANDFCDKKCDLGLRACTTEIQQKAMLDYETYARGQWLNHEQVELRPRDFEQPQKCDVKACHKKCEETHQTCYEACGGEVRRHSSCIFLCF